MSYELPEEVWLVGKGPSLDSYDWSQATGPKICINETVFLVPDPYAVIAIDYDVLDKLLGTDCIVMRKNRHTKYQFKNQWIWYMADVGLSTHATAPIAIQLLYKWGVRKIHFVGFDAVDQVTGYADLVLAIAAEGANMDGYKKISSEVLKVIEHLNITPVWEHL